MSPIKVTYPCSPVTGEPNRLTARQVWDVARNVRAQFTDPQERRLDTVRLVETASSLLVNGLAFEAYWDLDHEVCDEADRPVMGATEFDPGQPDSVMVSVNGVLIGVRDDLLRSTAAHELGHVVFDAPGLIRRATDLKVAGFDQRPSADWVRIMSDRRGPHPPNSSATVVQDWREFRANEFMGALLVPPGLLRVELQRFAKRRRLPLSDVPSRVIRGAPAYDGWSLDPEGAIEMLFTLAERFRVSEAFVRVRLDRYDLVRSGRQWHLG
ncbi:MAG TPA: hypothetical protein VFB16_14570 [Bauldia sp.]|nr:hypothetical protein [Bauldia sp.]